VFDYRKWSAWLEAEAPKLRSQGFVVRFNRADAIRYRISGQPYLTHLRPGGSRDACFLAILPRRHTIGGPKLSAKMGHVAKTPSVCDLTDRPVRLQWVL
jgi:hypothetical protein